MDCLRCSHSDKSSWDDVGGWCSSDCNDAGDSKKVIQGQRGGGR
jgi:hypothetical protein